MLSGMSIPHKKDKMGTLLLPKISKMAMIRLIIIRGSCKGAMRHGSLPLLEEY